MARRPHVSLLGLLASSDRRIARLVDTASLEAMAALGVAYDERLVLVGSARVARGGSVLPHGTRLAPAGDLELSSAFLYRDTYDARRLEEAARRHAPTAFGEHTVVVVDVELEPPPGWRYAVFRTLGRRTSLVSLRPLDPAYWSDASPDPARLWRSRLRAALVAATARLLELDLCDEPGCVFDRSVDGVDALDAMDSVGGEHREHPAAGHRFGRAARAGDPDPLVPPPRPAPRSHPAAFERKTARGLPIAARWEAGPYASLETFNARRAPGGQQLRVERRYETAWASIVRPPVESLELDLEALDAVRTAMDRAIAASGARGVNVPMPGTSPPGAGTSGAKSPTPSTDATRIVDGHAGSGERSAPGDLPLVPVSADTALGALREAGARLYDLLVPLALERGLPRRGVFLTLGVDELLLDLPLELMHDGEDHLALKHPLGRFVNSSSPIAGAHRGPADAGAHTSGDLRALVIGVSAARLAPGRPLAHAAREADETAKALDALGARVTLLTGRAATEATVYDALRAGPHLLHYAGHADLLGPDGSARLLVADGALDAAALARAVARRPPALSVLNACEAGRTFRFAGGDRIRGLADGFLAAGGYVLGARWPVADEGALTFAESLYEGLFRRGEPLGAAVLRARERTRRDATDARDSTWAAYVLYGDPRVAFRPRRGGGGGGGGGGGVGGGNHGAGVPGDARGTRSRSRSRAR